MKDISKNPDAIPELKLGDIVLCDGIEFKMQGLGRDVWFTSTDSLSEEGAKSSTQIRRKSDKVATMTKKDFLEILKKKAYYIG